MVSTERKTLLQFIQENCCNYRRGLSTGKHYCMKQPIVYDDYVVPLGTVVITSGGKDNCVVLDGEKKRCQIFEKCLVPTIKTWNEEFEDAVLGYMRGQEAEVEKKQKVVKPRYCECGAKLLPRQRYCAKCKKNRRKETKRKSKGSKGDS